ncbi:KdsC family phosphatase [Gemmiger sp.]
MIRLLMLDVDGTMTDGGVYYDAAGNEMKKFAIKDGAGILLAHAAGIRVMICTGRECVAVRRRAEDLHVNDVYQNVDRKDTFLREFMAGKGYSWSEVAYCGDDLNDLAIMAMCGFVACPLDAAAEVKDRADYICPQRGGEGVVRGVVERILRSDGRWNDAVKKAFHVEL